MDLSAIAGSPAFIALRTLAGADATTAGGATNPTDAATVGESLSLTPGASLHAVGQGIAQALSAADTAGAAGQSILGLLDRMQQTAGQGTVTDLSTAERQSLDQGYQADVAGIGSAVKSAAIGGANLLDGSLTGGLRTALGDGAQASIAGLDLTSGGSTLALAGTGLSTPQAAQAAVQAAIPAATTALDGLGAQAANLSAHAALVQSVGQAVVVPSGDDGGDGARLLALQIGQQLSAQPSVAIANASPQQVLALFRSS